MPAALDLKEEILALKKERNAVILAHNYQTGDIQDVADYVGDSLGLAYQAKDTDADVIAFCGVHFMAETAKIVNPGKIVVLPGRRRRLLARTILPRPTSSKPSSRQNADKNYYVIAYINCSGGVKALCDVICTSGNAVKIVNQAPADRPILFVPDENLGAWVMEQTGRKMDLWKGNCYVHVEFTRDSINRIKAEYPDALVVAHPECTQAVRLLADEVCSTEKMVTYCKNAPVKNIIVVTESGMLHRLRKECPDKNLIAGPTDRCACADCRYMKMNTLQKLRDCLDTLQPRVEMEESLAPTRRSPAAAHARAVEVSEAPVAVCPLELSSNTAYCSIG